MILKSYSSYYSYWDNSINRILILLIINDLLRITAISAIANYYYNFDKIFNNPERITEIDIKNNIDFDKITRKI